MKINKEYIKQFNPCTDGWKNYLKHYSDFNGTVIEFLGLDKITWDDKKWLLFHKDQKILSDKLLREFAIICASRAVDNANMEELNYFFMLNILMYESGENLKGDAAWRVANDVARCSAFRAARCSAWRSVSDAALYADNDAAKHSAWHAAWCSTSDAEEAIQLQILINLIESDNDNELIDKGQIICDFIVNKLGFDDYRASQIMNTNYLYFGMTINEYIENFKNSKESIVDEIKGFLIRVYK